MSAFTSSIRPFARATRTAAAFSARSFSSSSPHSLARMIITGRLTHDAELQATSSGQDVIKYSVATSFGPKENRQTSFFRIACYQPQGSQRDFMLGLEKGTMVYVEGDATLRQNEDQDGKKQSFLNISQKTIEVLRRPYNPEASARGAGSQESY